MSNAVVFAYHNVGVRCLQVLLARGVKVSLVISHQDNPAENIWFDSVQELARSHGIPVITPVDPNTPQVLAEVAACAPDFIFSFYYRQMLKPELLVLAKCGAYNIHGSLLPQYRGRVPINWAVLRGETETGATLHVMNEKPDNGAIVDQQMVPILPDDTAHQVFAKVTVACEQVLWRCLPDLMAGRAKLHAQDLSLGAYFGGRRPEDGQIDWAWGGQQIHNFVRALSQPYPGAWADLDGQRLILWRTRRIGQGHAIEQAMLRAKYGTIELHCRDGDVLQVLEAQLDGQVLDVTRNFEWQL